MLKTDTSICDGTFKTAPPPFDQIYTLFAVFGEQKFPCVGCFLKENSKASTNSFYESYESKFLKTFGIFLS